MNNNLLFSFFELAQKSPDTIVATDSAGKITCGELLENAQRCYTSIINLESLHKRIAIFLPGCIDALSSVISVLTAGYCYTAIDPSMPSERSSVICSTGDFNYVLTNNQFLSDAQLFFDKKRILVLEDLLKADPTPFSSIPDVNPDDGAVMFFTSGSTGTPKGVIHTHQKISLGLKREGFSAGDIMSMTAPLGFVASVNMFFALSAGAKINFFDLKKSGIINFVNFIKESGLTHCSMTITTFRAVSGILGENEKLQSLKMLLLGGEPVQPSDIELFRKHTNQGALLAQYYGTTETRGISSSRYSHNGAIPDKISTGKPSDGVTVYILDESLAILPIGETGQIAVSSDFMATEYYNNPEASNRSFIIHPETGLLTYLTGDLGYLDENGELFHQGRNDFMVKVRGSRVDILEIEDCLLHHPSVHDVVVVNKGDSFFETLLVAYCEVKEDVKISDIREYAISKLPAYMIPAFFILKDKFPQTSTRKADRKKLADEPLNYSELLGNKEESQIEFDPLYQKLKAIWMDELKLPRLSPEHCFFNDLGGDSVLAVMVLERMRKEMGIQLPYFILFRYRTLERLTAYIRRTDNKVVSIERLRLPDDDKSPVIIFVPPIKGGADTYNFAMKAFPVHFGLFVITYNVVDDDNRQFYSLDELMNRAAEIIDGLQFQNMYLYGYSMGGLLAFEMASRIKLARVRKLILIDIPPALKRKRNLTVLMRNDILLLTRNFRKKNFKAVRMNINHLGLCVFYLFSKDQRIRKFETKSQLTLAEAAHLRFYRQFDHGTFNGDMFLVRSTDNHFRSSGFGWKRYITGNIEVKEIQSRHYDILTGEKLNSITRMVIQAIE